LLLLLGEVVNYQPPNFNAEYSQFAINKWPCSLFHKRSNDSLVFSIVFSVCSFYKLCALCMVFKLTHDPG